MAKRFQLGPEIERYTQLLARDPESLAFVPLADAYRKSGLFEEAFAVLKRGMSRRPNYIPAKIVQGKCYLDLGNYPKAETTFEEILRIDRDNLVALSSMANVRLHQRRYGEAATIYRHILDLDPSNDAAAQQLAKLEGKALSRNQGEVIEIDLEAPTTQRPTGETEEVEEKVPDTIDFENVMRSEGLPPVRKVGEPAPDAGEAEYEDSEDRPAGIEGPAVASAPGKTGVGREIDDSDVEAVLAGGTDRGAGAPDSVAVTDESADVDLADISGEKELDVVDEGVPERPAGVASEEVSEVPLEETGGADEVPPVKGAGDEPEIDVEVPVPPPPDTEELELVEPEVVEVMPEDEVPPEIPPVKDEIPMMPADDTEKPAFRTFSSWLSGLAGRKGRREEDKDEESNSG